jgi:hypothetical protein
MCMHASRGKGFGGLGCTVEEQVPFVVLSWTLYCREYQLSFHSIYVFLEEERMTLGRLAA